MSLYFHLEQFSKLVFNRSVENINNNSVLEFKKLNFVFLRSKHYICKYIAGRRVKIFNSFNIENFGFKYPMDDWYEYDMNQSFVLFLKSFVLFCYNFGYVLLKLCICFIECLVLLKIWYFFVESFDWFF